MAKTIEVKWEVEDGYVGRARPQYFDIDVSDYEGLSEEEVADDISDMVSQEFEQKISWICPVSEIAALVVKMLNDD